MPPPSLRKEFEFFECQRSDAVRRRLRRRRREKSAGGRILYDPRTILRSSYDTNFVKFQKFRQNVARFRLYRLRFLQENLNMRFAAFFKIYQILKLKFLKLILTKFCNFYDICNFFC